MILSRLLSLVLRFAEFICSVVVMGIMAHFIHIGGEPHSREIYTLVISVFSTIVSLIWMFPTVSHMLHIPADLFFTAAWFASFGILLNWIHKINCGSAFSWGVIHFGSKNPCSEWQAAEAFSFLAGIFFALSTLLGLYVHFRGEPTTRRRHVTSRV